jgi:hypothetical protein
LDRASTGCFATGVLVPAAGAMLGNTTVPIDHFFIALACWIAAGGALHFEARRVIASMRDTA